MTPRRLLALIALAVAVAVEAIGCVVFWRQLWGPGTWAAGGNVVAWAVLGTPAFVSTHVVLRRQHGERLAQAERHHAEMKKHVTAAAGGGM